MANLVKKSFDNPDDLVAPDKTRAEILEFGTIKAVRVTAQPGWTWSCLLYTSPSPRDRG